MRKLIVLLCVTMLFSAGCQKELYSLNDGLYMQDTEGEVMYTPFVQIHNGEFYVIQDIAISYQPAGKIERNGNDVILKSEYANMSWIWYFHLTDHDQLQFDLSKSMIPTERPDWKDGLVLNLKEE